MKKIMVITALLLFATSSAYAEVSITMASPLTKDTTGKTVSGATSSTGTSIIIGKTSTGVGIGVLCVTGGTGYSLVTQHVSGTKAFGSSYDSTSIYSKDVTTVGTPLLTVPTATDTTNFTSWTSL
jgi:hypothetical protein